ncbi:MAG: phospholipase D family protein [Gemmatimonadota bacterium]
MRSLFRWVLAVLVTAWIFQWYFHLLKPLPEGISVSGPHRSASGIQFLYDLTYQHQGERVVDHQIFDRILSMIRDADEFIVLDMFLFNAGGGDEEDLRPLSSQVTRGLLRRKREEPRLRVTFITDEINNFYGAYTSPEISSLQDSGIEVVTTNLERLRDSNPLYSAAWRVFPGWVGTEGAGWLPDLLNKSGQRVTARAYLKLLNFKANHRKLIVTEKECLVSSANPHDGSSMHSNIAFVGRGPICNDLLEAEKAVAALSGVGVSDWPTYRGPEAVGTGGLDGGQGIAASGGGSVKLVTEGKILQTLLQDLSSAGSGDQVDMAMFYLSERRVVEALVAADGRGAAIRLVLDPNKDAFGREKKGIPNRQVAQELVTRSDGRISVRWYDTKGEQFHTKLVVVTRGDSMTVMGGSANLTRRNIGDYNLEMDLRFELPAEAPLAVSVARYFERVFNNQDADFTLPMEAYRDEALVKRILYRVQEFTGLCSF